MYDAAAAGRHLTLMSPMPRKLTDVSFQYYFLLSMHHCLLFVPVNVARSDGKTTRVDGC
jgi:hypothetical protein